MYNYRVVPGTLIPKGADGLLKIIRILCAAAFAVLAISAAASAYGLPPAPVSDFQATAAVSALRESFGAAPLPQGDASVPVTRTAFAEMLADAFPASALAHLNTVTALADVPADAESAAAVYALYRAGITLGVDENGTFDGDAPLTAAEMDDMLLRAAFPERRLRGDFEAYTPKDAYPFVETTYYGNRLVTNSSSVVENLASGWLLDNRGGTPRSSIEEPFSTLWDISETAGTAVIRPFGTIADGTVTAAFTCAPSGDGALVEFRDENESVAYRAAFFDGAWNLLCADGGYTTLLETGDPDGETAFNFRLYFDLDAGSVKTFIDDTACGESSLLAASLASFRFATDEAHTLTFTPGAVEMTANYAVYDTFDTFAPKAAYGWTTTGSVTKNASGEMALSGASTAVKAFGTPVKEKFVAETYFLLPANADMTVTLLDGTSEVLAVASSGGKLIASGEELYTLTKNMWYRLRIEGDLASHTADIRLNGRSVGTVSMTNAVSLDAVRFALASGTARFDNVHVFAVVEHDDYVPVPENRARFDDYTVMMNVCSIWRNDSKMYGWAPITPFDENKPVLGWYDEGSPELADWEIKYMVENGVDVQAFCWYNDASNGPLKKPSYSEALHDGFMNARYSDYMKYILILELSSGQKFQLTPFRNYVVPYLFENYFLDDRYLKIDNKIVLHTYGVDNLTQWFYFGSQAGVDEAFAYLDEKAREYGFDGFIILSNGDTGHNDGSAAYSWGRNGYLYETNVSSNLDAFSKGQNASHPYFAVPTVSVGYNLVAWFNARSPMMSASEFKRANEWVRDTYLPQYAQTDDRTWNDNLVLLSTWNEYGEGTYISPAGLNGFGYLNAVRDVFTDLPAGHTDVVPTEAQKARIGRLYPQNHTILARTRSDEDVTASYATAKLRSVYTYNVNSSNVSLGDVVSSSVSYGENGVTATSGSQGDPTVTLKNIGGSAIDDVSYIRVTLQVPAGSGVQVFFATEADNALSEAKSFHFTANTSGLAEYLIDAKKNTAWKGTLSRMRVDPFNKAGETFTLKSVEFLTEQTDGPSYTLTVNTRECKSGVPAETRNGKLLFPYDPQTGVHLLTGTFMRWDKAAGVLTLETEDRKAVYTVGADTYTLDGTAKPLGYTLYLSDGLPMLDFEALSDDFGFTYTRDGTDVTVNTGAYALYEAMNNRPEAAWEFNDYDTEGGVPRQANIGIRKEDDVSYLHIEATGTDPGVEFQGLKIPTAKYTGMDIRLRFKYSGTANTFVMYYLTDAEQSYSEQRAMSPSLGYSGTQTSWHTIHVDFADPPGKYNDGSLWNGTIRSVRFDPFGALGWMDIDYIRFIEDPDYVEPTAEGAYIVNGDAEDLEKANAFTLLSPDTTTSLTIEEDESDPANHVWRVIGKKTYSWTYFTQPFNFDEGRTYIINFDARALPDSQGNVVDTSVVCNLRYADSSNAAGIEHTLSGLSLPSSGEWRHFHGKYTVTHMDTPLSGTFTIFGNPPTGSSSACFEVDNVTVAVDDGTGDIVNGSAEGRNNLFYPAETGRISIVTDSADASNRVYRVSGAPGRHWMYFQHDYGFESGGTYTATFRARALPDTAGNSEALSCAVNFRYYETGRTNYEHIVKNFTLPADGTWVTVTATATVGTMYEERNGVFSIYANPTSNGTQTANFEVDDITVTKNR